MSDERDDGRRPAPGASDLVRVAPGVARIAASAAWRTAGWGARAYANTAGRVVRAAVNGESPAQLFSDVGNDLRSTARELLGVRESPAAPGAPPADGMSPEEHDDATALALRRRGEELLRQSADVDFEEDAHPAYARILDELSPDEARILRFMHSAGPQPAVDVRTGVGPIDIASQLIAPGLNMIGAHAGCRHVDRVPAYLNNLYRLGLIWFSREPLRDPLVYQVLEAQPDVIDALREAGRVKKTVRRSIALTPFGEDFCRLCLPPT